MSDLRPKQILREISHQWPDTQAQVKKFRADKGKCLPEWLDWCYLPIAAGYAISTHGGPINARLFDARISPAVITAAASWRVSQGVYRFDADLYNALINQPMDGNVPCEALKRLPEWCVYIETIGANFRGVTIVGFWAHLENDMNDGRMELRLVLMCNDGKNIALPIHLGNWALEEGLSRMQAEACKNAGVNLPDIDFIGDIVPLVQLVLYLCAENADMLKTPIHPSTRVRMSGQVDVPKEVRLWNVGERIGTAIRKYQNQELKQRENQGTGTHASPRPHMRRAHWHHFLTGERKGERKLLLRWLPPIPVGVYGDEGPVVIHEVR